MHIRYLLSSLFLALLLLTAAAHPVWARKSKPPAPIPASQIFSNKEPWVEETLSRMTLSEKVGQMIVAGIEGQFKSDSDKEYLRLSRLAGEGRIGGIMFLKGDVLGAAMLANHFQSLSKVPLLVSSDMERGLAMRLDGATEFSPSMAVAATGNPELASRMAKVIASEARAVGIHQNYAPSVDLNTNPSNPVINIRSFGDKIPLTISISSAIIDGFQSNGLVATAKHFPGHGDVSVDSHLSLPVLEADRQRLEEYELKPFKAAIEKGVLSVMIGHLAVPKLTGTFEPASLSKTIVTDLLRKELGFRGLIVTDAMNMKALYNGRNLKDISVRAVQAGNDQLLFPIDPELAHDAVLDAVERGEIPVSQIDDSVRRILHVKLWLGLDRQKMVDLRHMQEQIGSPENIQIAESIAENAITLIRDRNHYLPFRMPMKGAVVNIILQDKPGREKQMGFADKLGIDFTAISLRIDPSSGKSTFQDAKSLVGEARAVILSTDIQTLSVSGHPTLNERQIEFVRTLPAMVPQGTPIVLLSFGAPYILDGFPEIGTALCTYGENEYAQRAAIRVLKGELTPKGTLPVSLAGGRP